MGRQCRAAILGAQAFVVPRVAILPAYRAAPEALRVMSVKKKHLGSKSSVCAGAVKAKAAVCCEKVVCCVHVVSVCGQRRR